MKVCETQPQSISFKNAGIATASFLEENVMLNKAILDGTVDASFVYLANNDIERKERLRRVSFNYFLCFLTPFITLPLTNRLAMKYIAKLTPKFTSKESNLIRLSNKYLVNAEETKKGIDLLSKKLETDYKPLLDKVNGDYEKLRIKLINAKNAVLSFDFLFSSGSVTAMAVYNNKLTKDKTKMDGYSAEFELADKETVEKRAAKFKKTEPIRKGAIVGLLGSVTLLPFAIRKGLISPKNTGLAGFIKKHADKFDYTKGIFMKRLPLFLFAFASQGGLGLASRNFTELKNNLILSSTGIAVYFGGDLVINSLLSRLSDKFLKTEIIDRNAPKTFINKIIPPTIPIKNLKGKSKVVASVNFFINLVLLAIAYGYGVPTWMNRNVRKDLKKDAQLTKPNQFQLKPFKMEDFIQRK